MTEVDQMDNNNGTVASPAWAKSAFLKACRCEPTDYTPIWLMRQAGRYMKEYRDLRSRVSFLDLCQRPDLATEVMITAVERLGVDAAIIFSDILLILQPMGMDLEYVAETGPVLHNPVRTVDQAKDLQEVEPSESLNYVFEAVKATRAALPPHLPLIGFAGAPFTVASYMIEGGGSKNYRYTKQFMYCYPSAWHDLMALITRATVKYLNGQVTAGAQALQLFDSWIGCLSPADYQTFVFPHMQSLFAGLSADVPVIHFGTGNSTLLKQQREAGGDVIGLDFRVDLVSTWDQLGGTSVQGNLDPCILFADPGVIQQKAKQILDQVRGRNGHIFNLGHGVLPETPVDHVRELVDYVHNQSTKN